MTDPTPQTTPTRDEAAPMTTKRWPFVESPGDFAMRLEAAYFAFDSDMLAAVRNCLIENPPMLASAPAPASGRVDAVGLVPLKWRHVDVEQYEAHSIIGTYEVCGPHWSFAPTLKKAGAEMGSLDEAREAAQSHRDLFGPQPRPASLSPAAMPVSEAGGDMIPRAKNVGRYLAETNDGRLLYLNHATEWHEMPNILAKPASSPAGGGVHEAAIGLLSELDAYCVGSRAYDRRVNEARRALKAALSQSTSAGDS